MRSAVSKSGGNASLAEARGRYGEGSVRVRACKYSLRSNVRHAGSSGFQDGHYGRGATEKAEPAVVGGHVLMGTGAGTKEATQFIIASTEPTCRSWALEPAHRLVTTFDATVILFQAIVEIAAGAMAHRLAQRRADRPGIAVVAIRGHA